MKQLSTQEISRGPIPMGDGEELLKIYHDLYTPVSDDVLTLSQKHRSQIEDYALQAAMAYGNEDGPEQTRVQAEHGIPALVVRVDCTVDTEGNIVAYEMEDSPSGQGITHTLVQRIDGVGLKDKILEHYNHHLGEIPHILVSGLRGHGTDDALIVGEQRYSYPGLPKNGNHPVIVKSIPGVPESHLPHMHLQDRAVAPLITEGNKMYGERLGQLKPVNSPDDLLRDSHGELVSQVLKRRIGSMAMGIHIYLNNTDRKIHGKNGSVTVTKLSAKTIEYASTDGALTQRFVAPVQLDNAKGANNAILRVFVLLSGGTVPSAEAIGGCYVARPTLIVHGASDSVNGAILVE